MCGIIGIFNHHEAGSKIKTALALLHNRGRDGCGLASSTELFTCSSLREPSEEFSERKLPELKSSCLIGHTLHAVVNNVPQPIRKKGLLSANCEIYNWQKLAQKYSFTAQNDADFLVQFLDQFGLEKIDELDGVYAFAYWRNGGQKNNFHSNNVPRNNLVFLARDIIGEKPLWYFHSLTSFAFASEKKVLEKMGFTDVTELNPRAILQYNINTNQLSITRREFFAFLPETSDSAEVIKEKTRTLLQQAIAKRIPQAKFGLLFSGGIDSTYLAKYFRDHHHSFTCYTAVLDTEGVPPSDLLAAQQVAKALHLDIKIKKIKITEIPSYLQKIVPLIEDSNVTKVGVALTFYLACELAKEDGCKVIFSGLGSEEIFAGYERHKQSANINQECFSGLLKMYERDLYRDDVLTMNNNLELRLPYLDKNLIEYALKIPEQYKIKEGMGKHLLRCLAAEDRLSPEFAFRKKTAAQYGSRFDSALSKLAKKNSFSSKSAYLQTFYAPPNVKLGVLFSSGKDSMAAAYLMKKQNYELTCLITIKSQNSSSYMFQSAGTELVELQAQAMELPLLIQETRGEKELELLDLEKALSRAKQEYEIQGIVSGALFSTYQRDRIERICDKLGLKIFSPLWHKRQEQHLTELLQAKFKIVLTAVAADGLDKTWLGRALTLSDVEALKRLHQKNQLNIAGEGGEFESAVLDCPLFKKEIQLKSTEILEEQKTAAQLIIHQAVLVPKVISDAINQKKDCVSKPSN